VRWDDPGAGNKKLSLVDLTGRKAPSLANDGSHPGRLTANLGNTMTNSAQVTFGTGEFDARAFNSTVGLGGDATSGRCDQEALAGRMGRLETCVVNAAMMKSRYPHIGGKKFNKPIVVDIDLPVWGGSGDQT
jgi:hypothetical protein